MDGGKLDRRVTFLRAELMDDGLQERYGDAAPLGTVWASKTDVSDGERERLRAVGSEITARFVVRSNSVTRSVLRSDLLTCDGLTYEVVAIKEIGRRDGIEISAVAKVA